MFLKDETKTPPQKNIPHSSQQHFNRWLWKAFCAYYRALLVEGPTALHTAGKWIVYFDKVYPAPLWRSGIY